MTCCTVSKQFALLRIDDFTLLSRNGTPVAFSTGSDGYCVPIHIRNMPVSRMAKMYIGENWTTISEDEMQTASEMAFAKTVLKDDVAKQPIATI